MEDKNGKIVIDVREQLRRAYGVKHLLSKCPELGEFEILPLSAGDDLGNLQRMVEIDLESATNLLLDSLHVAEDKRELKRGSAINLVAERAVVEQRNRVLRTNVLPPEGLRAVWDWVACDGAEDPMNGLPRPALNELFKTVLHVTRGSYQLTESGDPLAEAAAKK